MDRIGYHNNVEYTLISQSQGRVVIDEPRGYDEGNGNIYKRDPKGKGFLKSRKDALQFYGNAYDTLLTQTSLKGIAEDMALEKIEKDRTRLDEEWRGFPLDYLDLGTIEYEEKEGGSGIAKLKTTQGGLRKLVDSKFSDDLDLTAVVDIEGNSIPALERDEIFLEPKEIFLRSRMFVEEPFTRNFDADANPFLLEIEYSSDEAISPVFKSVFENSANVSSELGNLFYLKSTKDRVLKLSGNVKMSRGNFILTPQNTLFHIGFWIYDDNLDFSRTVDLYGSWNQTNLPIDNQIDLDFDSTIELKQGESISFAFLNASGYAYNVENVVLNISENSTEPSTNSNCLTYKSALSRLLYMITGQEIEVVSDILTDGELSEDILLNGFWARQFPDIVQEGTDEERVIQFKTSLKKLLDHIEAIKPIAWWIEVKGDYEVFRLEDLKYTQQNFIGVPFCNTTIDPVSGKETKVFPEAYKIKRRLTKKDFFSKVELGSAKGGEGFEEVYGLQSFCGKATFSTINSNNDSTYSKLSPYRLGDVDVELARRKPYESFPDEDTQYDSDIMCIRAKKMNGRFYLKKWQDSYEIAPTGVFGVDSAYNFEFSPAQLLINSHGFVVKSGLYHYPTSNVVFAESNCNSSLVTKKAGQDEIRESPDKNGNGLIPVSRLENPRVRPQTFDCTLQVTQEIEDFINGYTDGKPNLYGLWAINTGQTIEYFRMIQVDANKEGKLKLIEAFIT